MSVDWIFWVLMRELVWFDIFFFSFSVSYIHLKIWFCLLNPLVESSVSVAPNKIFFPANMVGNHSPGPMAPKKETVILHACLHVYHRTFSQRMWWKILSTHLYYNDSRVCHSVGRTCQNSSLPIFYCWNIVICNRLHTLITPHSALRRQILETLAFQLCLHKTMSVIILRPHWMLS